ncbi:MAG: PQQ-like beta-propeller repeat protein [Prolixibacteraceae bacterium]|jgi:outer membrane protein assembly factor BamB|nr:PQQ-like beta-propeller repeat protein [Prolixibacteraceae bacterium]
MTTKILDRIEKKLIAFSMLCILLSLFSSKTIAQINQIISPDTIKDYNDIPELHWKFKTHAPIFASPIVDENLVYVGGVDSILFAVDIQTGIEKWRFRTKGEIRSNVYVNDNQLYLNGGDGNLYALSKKTGTLLWTFSSIGERKYDFADYFHSSPIFKNGIVYFGSGDGNLYAIDSNLGKLVWSFKTGNIVHSTPAIDNDKIFFGSFDGFVYALK